MSHSETNPNTYLTQALENGVLTLTLGAGKAHPMSLAMLQALDAALAEAEQDDQVGAVVLHGPGHIFCAGHDLKEIASHRDDADQGRAFLQQLFDQCAVVMTRLTQGSKPTIAMVDGLATAAGAQMVAACDLAFASQQATFCLPGVQNGGFCSTPSVAVGRSLSRKHAMEMALSGDVYDADWAVSAGLVNRVVARQDLLPTVTQFAEKLAARHTPALTLGKQTFYNQLDQPLEQAYVTAGEAMLTHFMDPWRVEIEREKWRRD